MDYRSKYLIKNTSILTVSNFSSKILVFFLVPLYTRILSTTEYGIYDIIMSSIQLLVPIFSLNISDGVLRYLMDSENDKNKIRGLGIFYSCISVLIFGSLLFINRIANMWDILNVYALETFLYYVCYVFNQLFIQTAKGQEQILDLGIAGVVSTWTSLFGNIIFLIMIPCGLHGFFIAYILGQFSSAIYLCWRTKFFQNISFVADQKLNREIIAYSLPLIFVTLGWFINNVSDRYVVTWLCGLAKNGVYSVAYKIPTIMTTLQNIFIQAWTISAIKEYSSSTRIVFYKKMFFQLNILMDISCMCLILCTKEIAKILYANDFFIAWKYVPFLLVSVVFNASAGFIGPILSAEKKSKDMAKSTFCGAIVNFFLNIVLISILDVQGAAIATAISSFVIFYMRHKSIEYMFRDDIYIKIILSWLLLIVEAILSIMEFARIVQVVVAFGIVILHFKAFKLTQDLQYNS